MTLYTNQYINSARIWYERIKREIIIRYGDDSFDDPVYVFHHIPKCGGTSIRRVLKKWYWVIPDYRSGWSEEFPSKVATNRLCGNHCLCGHFENPGNYIHERYPEILSSERFKIFTFIRDPLELRLSLYRYELKYGVRSTLSLEDHILSNPNYIANRFPLTSDNYIDVLDRYIFIGVIERSQACIDILAKMIGKRNINIPMLNTTHKSKPPYTGIISEHVIQEFKKLNCLDYMVYEYVLQRLDRQLAEL